MTSSKTIREKKLEAKSLIDGIKAIEGKGDDATHEEVAKAEADGAIVERLLEEIKTGSMSELAAKAGQYEANLSAMVSPNRPALGGDGGGNVGAAPNHYVRAEKWAVKSLGETLCESDAYKTFNPQVQGSMGIEIPNLYSIAGATKATFTTAGSTFTNYDRAPLITLEQQRLTVADLMNQGITTAPTIRVPQEDSYTNAATTVAEGGTKPEVTWNTSEVDFPVRKIAVTSKISDEMWADYPQLQSYFDGRLRFMVGEREEAQLLNGDGNSPNLTGILVTSGVQSQAQGADTPLDAIHKAITKVRAVGFFEPDAIVMHPTDYQIIRLEKDGSQQYYGGGPFMGPYSNPTYPGLVGPWGLRVVVTTAISAGTALVGAFRMGAMIFRRAGVTVTMTNTDQDDFVKNLLTIRAEERLAFPVWRPLAFCKVTGIVAS
jgi:HK97 family phage major capsid protein